MAKTFCLKTGCRHSLEFGTELAHEDTIHTTDSPGIHTQRHMPDACDAVFIDLVRRGSVLIRFVEKRRVQAELGQL